MITKGNYNYFDFNSNRDKFIEVFTNYYGEQYRELLTEKINSIKYVPFHSQEFIMDYYQEFLMQYRDKLLDDFYKKTNLERNDIRDELVYSENGISLLEIAISGGLEIHSNRNINNEYRNTVLELREKAYEAFDIKGTEYTKYLILKDLCKVYRNSLNQIYTNNDCQIFKDIKTLENNEIKIIREYLLSCESMGYNLTQYDLDIINNKDFCATDLYFLDCNNILLSSSIQLEGYVSYFTSESQEKLNNGTIEEKTEIIKNRLKYLVKNGIKLNLDKETIENDDNILENYDYYKILLDEYFYQKNHLKYRQEFDYVNNLNGTADFDNGNFFPMELADMIEEERKSYKYFHLNNCEFIKNLDLIMQEVVSEEDINIERFTSIHNYINGDKNNIELILFACEDEIYKEDEFLCVLMHEINHLISHNEPFKITKNYAYTKSGVDMMKFRIVDNKITNINDYKDNGLILLEENINERQSKELTKLYLEMFENPVTYGDGNIYELDDFNCNYEYYDFLTEDFYNLFREQLKEQKINPKYDLYRNKNLNAKPIIYYLNYYKYQLKELFNKENNGTLDFNEVRNLGNLLYYFQDKFLVKMQDNFIIPSDLPDGENLEILTQYEQNMIRRLKDESEKIVRKLSKENIEKDLI